MRGRSDRPRARGTSDRRRDRGWEGGGTAEAELRKARAGGRNCVRRWGAAHPSRELICFSIPLGRGVVGVCVGRSQRDGDRIVALHLVQEDIDASDNVFVGNRLDGAGREQFDAVETVGDNVVAR